MNKEEKEAIERLDYFEPDDLAEYVMYRDCVETIKKLIKKQQKEIEGLNNLIGYMIGVSNGMDKEIVKIKKENKILKNVFNQIRDLTIHYIVWYDYNSKNYNLKGCSKQEIYKNFGRIREIVYAHYCNMNNEKALESLIDDKLKEE